jgi:MFS family permease
MIVVALPDIRADYNIGHAQVAWLVSAYLIAMAVGQPLGGRLGDQLGHSLMVRLGLIAVVICSLSAALAPNFFVLVVFRTGQALAAMIPNGIAMLRAAAPPERLGEAAGITSSAPALAAAIGPLLGGSLLLLGSWRWLFLFNLPIVLLSLLAVTALAYRDGPRGNPRIDILGTASLVGLLTAVTFLLSSGTADNLKLTGGLAAAGVFVVALLRSQLKSRAPVAEWSLLRSLSYSAPTAYVLLSYMVMYTIIVSVPFFVIEVQQKGIEVSAVLITSMALPMALASPLGGRLSDQTGRRFPSAIGGVCVCLAAMALTVAISDDLGWPMLAAALALLGCGMGLSLGPATVASVEAAPRALAGSAAGTTSMMRYIGTIIGAGLLGGILGQDAETPGVELFRLLFLVLTTFAVMAVIAALAIAKVPVRAESDRAH